MTVYQALQLNAAGSKKLIAETEDRKLRLKWSAVYVFKVLLTVAFCFLFVTAFSVVFGNDNSIVGVVVLLALLAMRQADFGMKTSHGVGVLLLIFAIWAVVPKAANLVSPAAAFLLNFAALFVISVSGCHNIIMYNQFTFALGFLLLEGYEAKGVVFRQRLAALALGAVICSLVYWKNHRKVKYRRTAENIRKEFDLTSQRSRWQLGFSLAIASSMLAAELLGLPRTMWVGISVMSMTVMFREDVFYRAKRRAPFGAVGCVLFLLIYYLVPVSLHPYIGILGGIGVRFSASYSWQTIFNTLGAVYIASAIFGPWGAVLLRITANVFATAYALGFQEIFKKIAVHFPCRERSFE